MKARTLTWEVVSARCKTRGPVLVEPALHAYVEDHDLGDCSDGSEVLRTIVMVVEVVEERSTCPTTEGATP